MTSPKGVIYHFSNQGTYGAKILYYTEMLDFTKAVGKGSRVQVDGFIFLILSSTSCCEMSEKQQRGWGVSGCKSAVKTGRAEELDRKVNFFCTTIKVSHLSFVASK